MSKAAVVALILLGTACWSAHAETSEMRAGGTGSATALLRRLATEFERQRPDRVEIIANLGTGGAIRALADGALDLAVAGRPLKAEEQAQGLNVAIALQTPFIFATSHKSPTSLSAAELVKAFQGPDLTWSDRTPIRVILRPRSESDVLLMGSMFPGLAPAIEAARQRPGLPIAATDQDNADLAEQIEGSLASFSLTQLVLEKRDLRLVPIDGLIPTRESFGTGAYPYAKTLYFVARANSGDLVASFLAFVTSEKGQDILREAYVFPQRTR